MTYNGFKYRIDFFALNMTWYWSYAVTSSSVCVKRFVLSCEVLLFPACLGLFFVFQYPPHGFRVDAGSAPPPPLPPPLNDAPALFLPLECCVSLALLAYTCILASSCRLNVGLCRVWWRSSRRWRTAWFVSKWKIDAWSGCSWAAEHNAGTFVSRKSRLIVLSRAFC